MRVSWKPLVELAGLDDNAFKRVRQRVNAGDPVENAVSDEIQRKSALDRSSGQERKDK